MMKLTLLILTLICWLLSFGCHLLWYLHMFQLNGYKPRVQLRWLKDNFLPAVVGRNLAAILTLPLLFLGIPGQILSCLLLLLSAWLGRPKPKQAKKPLVYTARIKRLLVTCGVLTALCLLIGSLRVLCGQHYISDVLAALALSLIISLIGYSL